MKAAVVCVDGAGLLMDYLEGAVSEQQRLAIDAHLAGCARCIAFVKSYQATPRILREATTAAMPGELKEALRRFLAARRR